ncbi:MAG: xanthine dehydrogenase family protein subunit M [bacterium]|nr:xanthine dehydrogenase family protein subunit M [bacterium]
MNNFTYLQPKSLKEAAKLFKDNPDALPYAGGTDLLGMLKDEIIDPGVLVDLKALPGMDGIRYTPGKGLTIGALVRVEAVASHKQIKQKYTALAEAAAAVGSPQLRRMGTMAGNLCQRPRCWYFRGDFKCLRKGGGDCFAVEGDNRFHAILGGGPCFIVHPSDTAVALMAFNASVEILSGRKKQIVPLKDFFVLPDKDVMRENILQKGDMVTGIIVPDAPADLHSRFLKFSEREVWDFATVSGAVAWQGSKEKIKSGRLVLGGVAPIPWLEETVSRSMAGATCAEASALADGALKDAEPMAHNGYKLTMARNLIKRLFTPR